MAETALSVDDLRRLIGEAIPDDGAETDTRFSDDELQKIISRSGTDLAVILANAWAAKAAKLADLVDVNEDGSVRQLSQLFKNARAMMETYAKQAVTVAQTDQLTFRATAVGFCAFDGTEEREVISMYSDGEYITGYPLHKFPQVK